MGRMNNTARSLIIVSKANGWDPCKIDGSEYANCDYPEDRVTKGDTAHLGGPLPGSPQSSTPDPGKPGADTRQPGPGGQSHGVHDPYGPGNIEG